MEKFSHRVEKYALIVTAAQEIITHLRHYDGVESWKSFHLAHIERAATFINFIEDLCIIAGSEVLTESHINSLWNIANHPEAIYRCTEPTAFNLAVSNVVERYQREIKGKFNQLTAPF